MPLCEIKPLLFGRLDDSSYNLANFLFYAIYKIERKPRSWVRRLNLKNIRMMHLVDQQSQIFVSIRPLECLKENS